MKKIAFILGILLLLFSFLIVIPSMLGMHTFSAKMGLYFSVIFVLGLFLFLSSLSDLLKKAGTIQKKIATSLIFTALFIGIYAIAWIMIVFGYVYLSGMLGYVN
jgi:hypothetical protein